MSDRRGHASILTGLRAVRAEKKSMSKTCRASGEGLSRKKCKNPGPQPIVCRSVSYAHHLVWLKFSVGAITFSLDEMGGQ